MADAAALKELAPTGKLRLAIAVSPSPSAQFAIQDGNTYRGVAVTLGRALGGETRRADRDHPASGLGRNPEFGREAIAGTLPFFRSTTSARNSSTSATPTISCKAPSWSDRASKIQSVKDADAKGIGLGGVANTATFRAAKKATPNATHIDFSGVDAAVAAMREGKIEGIALSRESLSGLLGKIPGSRMLDDAFLNSSTAVCVPKGKPAALAYVSEFIEEAKASGLVRKALDEMGLKSSQLAPAGMKP